MSRTPLFKQEAWARLVSSTLTALHGLLGTGKSAVVKPVRKRIPKPVSTEKAVYAHKMLHRMLDFLQEVAEHRIVMDQHEEERDVVLYPSQVFYRDDVITRLRK